MSEAERKYPITSDLEHILLDKAIQLSEAWRELETLRKLAITFLIKGDSKNALRVLQSGDE